MYDKIKRFLISVCSSDYLAEYLPNVTLQSQMFEAAFKAHLAGTFMGYKGFGDLVRDAVFEMIGACHMTGPGDIIEWDHKDHDVIIGYFVGKNLEGKAVMKAFEELWRKEFKK